MDKCPGIFRLSTVFMVGEIPRISPARSEYDTVPAGDVEGYEVLIVHQALIEHNAGRRAGFDELDLRSVADNKAPRVGSVVRFCLSVPISV